MPNRRTTGLTAIALLFSALLIAGPLRDGFTRMETDFPNYYTAAVLTAKRMPLRQFYDWVWFQRQMHYAGIENQLGGYIPHTAASMLPFLPLTGFPPQTAKRIWIAINLLFLAASVLMLASISLLSRLQVFVLCLLAYWALGENFRLGQYYIFLLFLLTASFYCLLRRNDFIGGAGLGLVCALKLYTTPFVLYFVVRKKWNALYGFLAAIAAAAIIALVLFGWSGVWYSVTTVTARGLDGSIIDPYNPGLSSMAAFLRHTFIRELELNPHPIWNAPWAFFFLRSAYSLGILAISLLAIRRIHHDREREALAWFVVVLFALSPNEASYTFLMLALPVAILLPRATKHVAIAIIALYVLIQLPLFQWDAALFPKVWLVLALLLVTGWTFLRQAGLKPIAITAIAAFVIAAAAAFEQTGSYTTQISQRSELAILEPGAIYSSAPALAGDGWMYERIGDAHYVIRTSGNRDLQFDGDAFHPAAPRTGRLVVFELAAKGHSQIMAFDRETNRLSVLIGPTLNPTEPALSPDGTKLAFIADGSLYWGQPGIGLLGNAIPENAIYKMMATGDISNPAFAPDATALVFAKGSPGNRIVQSIPISGSPVRTLVDRGDCFQPSISPDGRQLAYVCSETGATHVWVQNLSTQTAHRLTSGSCNTSSPAWDLDSRSLVVSSDCNRGLGLPALYWLRF